MPELFPDLQILPRGRYLQFVAAIRLLDDAIIRSNEPEEVLTYNYRGEGLGNRFIIPWRKTKGKVRRNAMDKMRGLGIGADCHLKDGLCMKCPCCVLFGGTGDVSSAKVGYNLLSRVLGDTFISVEPVDTINSYTANAIDEKTLSTGQALMTIVKVPAETEFLGVVTLRDPTSAGAAIVCDALERLTRIGASSREWGRCRTVVRGYRLSDREEISSYELAGRIPADLAPVSDLKVLSADDAYRTFAEHCDAMLASFADTKKGQKTRGSRAKPVETPEQT